MKFTILIILYFFNPLDRDMPGHDISHLDGKPLTFKSESACYQHVDDNYNNLKKYIETYYNKKATIGKVLCVQKNKD